MDATKPNLAERLLAERASDNDERFGKDVYSRYSLDRFRRLSLTDLKAAQSALGEVNRQLLLDKMSWKSRYSLLSGLALLSYLLAFAGIVGGASIGDSVGIIIGIAAAAYAVWHFNYEKRLIFERDLRNKDVEIAKWVLIEKGDEVTTRFAGLSYLSPENSPP